VVACTFADCARSGDFRSITHHFRQRRSVDQQQTDAEDEYDLHQRQQPQSDDAAAARLVYLAMVVRTIVFLVLHRELKKTRHSSFAHNSPNINRFSQFFR